MPAISKKSYRVGRSRTGLGLFATQPIEKGAKIVRYFGPLLDSKKKKDDAIENKYLFELNDRWTIDGSVRANIARYINHACKPNAESDVKPRKRKVIIRAIKNIEPGEEINYDYGTDYFKAYLKPIGCKCDACEKKRAKKRAEARAEKLLLKVKAERKALRAAKLAAEARAKVRAAAKAKAKAAARAELKAKANGATMASTELRKELNGHHQVETMRRPIAASARPNGRALNGHGRLAPNQSSGAEPRSFAAPEVPATAAGTDQQASA